MTAEAELFLPRSEGAENVEAAPPGGLRIALVDPSLFTIPYDAKLAHALRELGHDVTVYGDACSPDEDRADLGQMEPVFYRELATLEIGGWPRAALRLAKGALHGIGMRRLAGELRAARPDIVHFQWLPLPPVDRLFLTRLRRLAPLVLTAHNSRPFNNAAWRLQKFGATSVLGRFDRVIVHTDEARDRLIAYGVAAERLARIPHGPLHDAAPVSFAPCSNTDPVRFLLFGKLKPYKGADLLIEAFRRLPERLQDRVEILIVGKPYMDVVPLRAAAEALQPRVRVDFRFVPDAEMGQFMALADVIVFPYREIDVSGVLMAALRYGRPIVASRIGGFAELLIDGRHGLLVPPGDAGALSAAMARLCERPAERKAMGCAVAELGAAVPGWDEIAARTCELYRSLLAPIRTTAPAHR